MNNGIPFFYPFNNFPNLNNNTNNEEYERLMNKIERLEKNIRILDTRVKKIEQKYNANNIDYLNDEPTDMYII